jgi:hypothetical protein
MSNGEEAFRALMQTVESGEHPVVNVERYNVIAAIENDDKPSVFLASFVGIDKHTNEKTMVHVELDGSQLAGLMEQFCAAAISEFNYAINGVRTLVTKDGIKFLAKEDGE